jgi:hypothetical protein
MTQHFITGCLYYFFMWTVVNSIRGHTIKPFGREWWTDIWIFTCTFLGVTFL